VTVRCEQYPDFAAACEAVGRIAHIQPGEKAVILAERKVEPDVIYGLWAAVQARGGQAWACLVERAHESHVPSVVAGVLGEADVVFHSWVAAHSPDANRLRREKGQRWIAFADCLTFDRFLSPAVRFPIDLMQDVIGATWRRIDQGQGSTQIHITDPKGTDLWLEMTRSDIDELAADPRWQGRITADGPMTRSQIPCPHGPNLFHVGQQMRNQTATGVVRYDSIVGFGGSYSGGHGDSTFVAPVSIHLERAQVVKVEGGWEADVMRRQLADGQLAEIGMGFNPQVPAYDGKFTGAAGGGRAGTLHIATEGAGIEHADGVLHLPTVTVDGRELIRNGRLVALDDPAIVERSREYLPLGERWLWDAAEDREDRVFR
jgi:hypothetical protein